jgi:hypothetical protein
MYANFKYMQNIFAPPPPFVASQKTATVLHEYRSLGKTSRNETLVLNAITSRRFRFVPMVVRLYGSTGWSNLLWFAGQFTLS